MANIVETSVFEAGIYKIETSDPVLGGNQDSIANEPHRALANRTKYLKDRLDAAGVGLALSYAGNMNTLANTGFYFIASGASNKPSGVTTGFCTVVNDSSTATFTQMLVDAATDTVWFRRIYPTATPNAWKKLRTEDTATQSALFESWADVSGYPTTVYRDGKICVSQGRIEGGTPSPSSPACSFGSTYAPSQDLFFEVKGGTVRIAATTCNVYFDGTIPTEGVSLNLTWRTA